MPEALEMVCSICGCTQDEACVNPQTGETCSWIISNNVVVCSFCAEEQPLVELYTEGEANAFIRDLRAADADVARAERRVDRAVKDYLKVRGAGG